ncbi:hypothetical protein AAW51_1907 [Caldimonas brevitalea]|uniref:Uncharacterized protein n=2 Tax=Caldimonas brevitalea TaxID=413882 RepID=A0A0G3BKT2_9BURK|nr:hypothetical protein AAW51_1907 [Caldimonas brevitalea]
MVLLEDFKRHTGLALIFLAAGFIGGLLTYRHVAGIFNADVVLKNSYIYKSEIERTHVPVERYKLLSEDLKDLRSESEKLKALLVQSQLAVSALSGSVCDRFTQEANSLMVEQQSVERQIQQALDTGSLLGGTKADSDMEADGRKAAELRRYSAQLQQQLMQVRGEIARCGNGRGNTVAGAGQ